MISGEWPTGWVQLPLYYDSMTPVEDLQKLLSLWPQEWTFTSLPARTYLVEDKDVR